MLCPIQIDHRSIIDYHHCMKKRNWRVDFRWDETLSFDEAGDLINYILEEGRTTYSSHSFQRMDERGFTTQDVECILESGVVVAQEFDKEKKNWKYNVQGKTIDSDEAVVVTAVVDRFNLFIITVY